MKRVRSITLLIGIFFSGIFYIANAQQPGGKPEGGGGRQGMNANPIGVIRGTLVDEQSAQAIEYANVVLFKMRDSSQVTGALTNRKGNFTIEKVPFGKYFMKISFIGYAPQTKDGILVTPKDPELNLGVIKFKPSSSNLATADIKAEKQLVEYSLDKKIVNVEKNLTTVGGTAVDVLRNVPSVSVDADGNVSLRGNENITLLIDGRPTTIAGGNKTAALEQISSSQIESIEIITNPSAKYQAEGMTGILNIKLRKKRSDGLNGIMMASAGTSDKYNGSLNINYNMGKANIFASYDGSKRHSRGSGLSDRVNTLSGITTAYGQNSAFERNHYSNSFKLGSDFFINRMNTLTIAGSFNKGFDTDFDRIKTRTFNSEKSIAAYNIKDSREAGDNYNGDIMLNYKKTFEKKGRELTSDFSFSNMNGVENSDLYAQDYLPDSSTTLNDFPAKDITKNSYNGYFINGQVDYVHPLDSTMRFETGYKFTDMIFDLDFVYNNFSYPLNGWKTNSLLSNKYYYDQQIHAAYAILSKIIKSFTLQVGVRVENTGLTVDQKTQVKKYTTNYTNFFPSAHITQKLNKNNDIQLSYSRRINRPGREELNPFADYSNPLHIRYGNPYLKPEFINSIELGHIAYFKRSTISTSIFYKQINDVIKRYSFLDSNGVTNMTFLNLSKGISYGVELVADVELFKFWKVNATGSFFNTKIEGSKDGTELTNESMSWMARINSMTFLPKKFMIQLSANYMGPMVTPQGISKPGWGMDAAIKKDLFKDKVSIGFRVSDIFNTQKWNMTQTGDGFTFHAIRKRESRVAFLNITYKINKGVKQKGRKRDDNNSNGDGIRDEG